MTEIRSNATTVEASALRCLEPALKVRVGMLIVPSGGPDARGAGGSGGSCGARQPRGSDSAHGRGGRGGADLEQPLVQGEGVRPVGGIFGEAAED